MIKGLYKKIVHVLFIGKWMPKLLAFGGIHFLVLCLLFCQSVYMWTELNKNNVTSFNQILYHFYGDSLQNYRLNYLCFEKDMRRRPEGRPNPNDIKYEYGFTKIDTTHTAVKGKLKLNEAEQEAVIISKIRYITCNNVPDTLCNSFKQQYKNDSTLIYNTRHVSNHERYYYDITNLDNSQVLFRRVTHARDHLIEWDKMNPCFSFWIGIIIDGESELNEKSVIRIKFNDFDRKVTSRGYRPPLITEKIVPQPTYQNIKEIVYQGHELKEVIKQGGIYMSGVDPEKKEITEKKNLRTTVLLGTMIAFMLDICVQLVLKWRKLKE